MQSQAMQSTRSLKRQLSSVQDHLAQQAFDHSAAVKALQAARDEARAVAEAAATAAAAHGVTKGTQTDDIPSQGWTVLG